MTTPQLREELIIYPGPASHDGGPTWTLHDPQVNRFYRISWPAFEVLSRFHLRDPETIARDVNANTSLEMDVFDVLEVFGFLEGYQLLRADNPESVNRLRAIENTTQTSWFTRLLHHYIFFRLPLVRPDRLLEKVLPYVRWAGSKSFYFTTIIALLIGVFVVGREWDAFYATCIDHFSVYGLLGFALALVLAKMIHELAHALTAKQYGCRVPTMGVVFIVLWPMLYTDANEAWKLRSRRQRLMVGGAGILAELALAAWATLAWGVLPDGQIKTMAFSLAATTWISSLFINLSPFMRFDGYFLVMDALEQPNLHPRSFAMARWQLREMLFKLGEQPPEHLPQGTRNSMIGFAWLVWLYRLIVFFGIALLVYSFFIKVVAIVLFVVEIFWFIVRPVVSELLQWRSRAAVIGRSGRARISLLIICLAVAFLVFPWNNRIHAPALLKAGEYRRVYAPSASILKEVEVTEGQYVSVGTVLARLENPDLEARLKLIQYELEVLRYELSSIAFEDTFRKNSQTLLEELHGVTTEKSVLESEMQRLILTAPVDGIVTDLSPLMQPGQWINPFEPILGIRQGLLVEAYVQGGDLPRLNYEAKAFFIPEGSGGRQNVTVLEVDRAALKSLTEPSLAALYGGSIGVRLVKGALVPDTAWYRIVLNVDESIDSFLVPRRGMVFLQGQRRSLLDSAWRSAVAVLIREWGP